MSKIELHTSSRADNLQSIEEHLHSATLLSRALWEQLNSPECNFADERSREAAAEIASSIADHASAAKHVFHNRQESGNDTEGSRTYCRDINNKRPKNSKAMEERLKRRALKFLRAAWPLDLRNSLDAPNVAGSDEFKGALQAIVTLVSKLEGNVQ